MAGKVDYDGSREGRDVFGSLAGETLMGRRPRKVTFVLLGLLALLVAEVALEWLRGPMAAVRLENLGSESVESLVVSLGGSRDEVGMIEPGGSANIIVHGSGAKTLRLTFQQKGNAMSGYSYPDFDPEILQRDGSRLVLRIWPNEVERSMDEGVPMHPITRASRDLRNRVLKWVGIETEDFAP